MKQQNCTPPQNCPNCGECMNILTPSLRQCSRQPPCPGMVWDAQRGWNPASQEGALERRAEREHSSAKAHPLEPASEFLGRSVRSLYQHIDKADGTITMGMTYTSGCLAIRLDGEALVSTLGGGRHIFPVPPQTHYVGLQVTSGLVMTSTANILQEQHLDAKYKSVEVIVPACCSGVNVAVKCYDASGELIPPLLVP
jgi:hypothetical protein